MADVEKRLNSSLADLITQSKGSGTRGGKVWLCFLSIFQTLAFRLQRHRLFPGRCNLWNCYTAFSREQSVDAHFNRVLSYGLKC